MTALRSGFVLHSASLVGANGLQAILSGLYLAFLSRSLGPADFGLVSALLSSALLFAVVQGPLEMKISRDAAVLHGSDQEMRLGALMFQTLRKFAWPLTAGLIFAFLAAGPVSTWLHLGSSTHVILVAWFAAVSLVLSLARGVLRGGHRFGALAASQVIESGGRLVVGLSLLWLGAGTVGAISGYLAGAGIATVVALLQVPGKPDADAAGATTTNSTVRLGPLFILYVYWTLALNLDSVAARRFLDMESSGYYAAAAGFARMVWLVGTPTCHLILVRSASLEAAGQNGRRLARMVIVALAGCLGLSCLIPYLAGTFLIRTFFGEAFLGSVPFLRILWIATVVSILQTAVTFSQMGTGRIRRPWLFIAPCALLLGLLSVFHTTGAQIAYCVLSTSALGGAISVLTMIEGKSSRLALTSVVGQRGSSRTGS